MLEKKLSNLVNIMTNNLEILIKTRAVFVTISLIENTSYSENIKNSLRAIPNIKEIVRQDSDDQGLKILYDNLYKLD